MSPAVIRRIAALLVLGLVLTSLPARVWLFGACPVCGQIHVPILVAHVGEPQPPHEEDPDSHHPHDGDLFHTCCPPLPYCPTAAEPPVPILLAVSDVLPQSEPHAAPIPLPVPIRPPRA